MKPLYQSVASLFAISLAFSSMSQSIENIKAVAQGNKIIITFDIKDPKPGQALYNIKLYSSHDNFSAPLTFIKGDVGNEIHPGPAKRIEWEAGEVGDFKGEMTFEIRGELVAAWQFKAPAGGSSVKQGKAAHIEWQGGKPDDNVKIELVKGGKATLLTEGKNTGSYGWVVPKELKKGGGYQLRLTAKGTTIDSDLFAVKKKTPILLIVAPVAVAGGVAAALSGGGDENPVSPTSSAMPRPPKPN